MDAIAGKKITYDFSRFDTSMSEKGTCSRTRREATKREYTRAKTKISAFAVFSTVSVFVVLVALLFSYVKLTEASDLNRKAKAHLVTLQEENQMLEVNLNQRMGAMQIRDYAVTRLGMSKVDKSQITYVTTSGGDRFEIIEPEKKSAPKFVSGLIKGFSTIVEYIN